MRKMTAEESKKFKENKERLEGLERLCIPIIDYIQNNYGSYVSVTIDDERVRVIQEIASSPIKLIKESSNHTHF